jgi:hypothetical protein
MNPASASARRVRRTARRSLRVLTDICGAALYMWEKSLIVPHLEAPQEADHAVNGAPPGTLAGAAGTAAN